MKEYCEHKKLPRCQFNNFSACMELYKTALSYLGTEKHKQPYEQPF